MRRWALGTMKLSKEALGQTLEINRGSVVKIENSPDRRQQQALKLPLAPNGLAAKL
jgi:DNA-binding XRE family transcriptional regulator